MANYTHSRVKLGGWGNYTSETDLKNFPVIGRKEKLEKIDRFLKKFQDFIIFQGTLKFLFKTNLFLSKNGNFSRNRPKTRNFLRPPLPEHEPKI